MENHSNDIVEIPLRIGPPAIVDKVDAEIAQKYKWTWHRQGRGVVCYLKGQTILLHNLISPKKRVGFVDGNKRNCLRVNLVDWKLCISETKSRQGKEKFIYVDEKQHRIQIRRNLDYQGNRYIVATSISYKFKNFEEIMSLAVAKARALGSMTKESLVEYALVSKNRKTTNEIVCEWDIFNGRHLSNREFFESGVTFSDYD